MQDSIERNGKIFQNLSKKNRLKENELINKLN